MLRMFSIVCLLISLAAESVLAADFATSIQQSYTLTATGADVVETISVTNLSDLVFPTAYSLYLYSDQISRLSVTDAANQPINYDQTSVAATTKLTLHFPQPVVGTSQSQTYRVEYQHPDVRPYPGSAQYFIPHPVIPTAADVTTSIIIPQNICPKPLIHPVSLQLESQENFASLSYRPADLNQAVTILCQPQRYLNFTLSYQLNNPSLTPVETQITLPPDTASQRILFQHINPPPLRLNPDPDGNRIATYKLEPNQSLTVSVDASAVITNFTAPYQDPEPNPTAYTRSQPLWPTSDHHIKLLSKQFPSAQSIYNHLITTAGYNPDQFSVSAKRQGGQIIVANPLNLSGQDFTDAFITLCRADGIMSRRLVAYTQTNNQKLNPLDYPDQSLHVYPEWYDPEQQAWISVDPFWQKTNPSQNYWPVTDQLRLVLVINGHNDTAPYPANQITVTDTPAFSFPMPNLTASLQNSFLSKLFPNKTNLIITNHSNYAVYQEPLTLLTGPDSRQSLHLSRLDINSQRIIPINFSPNQQLALETKYGFIPLDQKFTRFSPTFGFTALLVTSAGLLAVFTGRLLVSRRKR